MTEEQLNMLCKICLHTSELFDVAGVLAKHPVEYYRCPHCGFIQTQEPYWLNEAYSNAITTSDIGLVDRNLFLAKVTRAIIAAFFSPNRVFLDYGGGYGLLVRLMRDSGLDFYYYDHYCANLFAAGFEARDQPGQTYDLATAFEVFEHLVDPLAEIAQILQYSKNVLFTTSLLPACVPRPTEWWYYGLEHGQHVALFSAQSLVRLAQHFGLSLVSDGRYIHLLTEKRISNAAFWIITRRKVATFVARLSRRKSLLASDYRAIVGRDLE